jgi:hypothetical protein
MSLGMPYAHIANALHFDYSGYTPLCFYDWLHETTPADTQKQTRGNRSPSRLGLCGSEFNFEDPGLYLSRRKLRNRGMKLRRPSGIRCLDNQDIADDLHNPSNYLWRMYAHAFA